MPTRTQPARRATTAGRFSRSPASAQRPATRRPATASRRPTIVTRRKPQKTGMAKMMESVGAALPGASKSARGSGGKGKGKGMGAGLAVLAGAAGLAMKNRGRLQQMMGRKDQDRMAHADAPAHPVVEVDPASGPVGTTTAPNATDTGVPGTERPAT
jgi:hypothetical protein